MEDVGVGLLQVNSPRWRLWWVRGMLLTYHYRHKCSGSTFRVAGAAASVADFTLVADDLGAVFRDERQLRPVA